MGRITGLISPVYLDANIFTYTLEGYPDFQARITILLEAMDHQEIERNVAWQRTYQEFCNHLST